MWAREGKPQQKPTGPPGLEGCTWGQQPQYVKKKTQLAATKTETRNHKSASGWQMESAVQGQHMASEY